MHTPKIQERAELEQLVYEAVEDIQGIKQDNRQVPDFATFTEVCNSCRTELLEVLRSLYRAGLLTHHKTGYGELMFGIRQSDHG